MEMILVIGVELFFIAFVILILYQLKSKLSLAPLYIFIGSNQYFQTILATSFYVRIFGDYAVSTGSIILFCSSLFAILLIYIKEGIPQTRTLIWGIAFSNITLMILAAITSWQIAEMKDVMQPIGMLRELFQINYRTILVGTSILILDSFLIVIVYEFFVTKTKILRLFGGILVALLTVLYFDSIVFSFGSFYGDPQFQNILIGQLIGKTFVGFFFALILFLFLKYTSNAVIDKNAAGHSYDIFSILTYREKFASLDIESTVFEKQLTAQLVNTLDTMSDGFISFDKDWRFTYISNVADSFLPLSRENYLGKSIWTEFPQTVGTGIEINLKKAVEIGLQIEFEEFYEPFGQWFSFKAIPNKNGLSIFFQDITEAKKALTEMNLVQQRNEALLNAIPDLMFVINKDGIYTDFRNPHDRYTIAPPESYVGASVKDIVSMELADETLIHVEKTLKTGETSVQNYQLPYPDEICFFESRYIKNSETEVLALVRDITSEKKTEIALKESEAKYRALIEQASDGILVHDFEGNILDFNIAATKYTGYTREEFGKLTIFDLLIVEDLKDFPIPFERLKNGETTGVPRRVKRKDGSIIIMELSSRMNDEGNVIAIARDITERLKSEDEIIQSENRFRTLTENAPVGIFQTDLDGNRVYVNEYWLEISGFTMAEALGSGWVAALHPKDKERVVNEWNNAIENGAEFNSEYRLLSKVGKTTLVQARAVRIGDSRGPKSGYIGTLIDITEQRSADAELKLYREHLEELVKIRTRELEIEKVKAQSADRLKSAFLATMSHELRTPLNSIIGFTGLLLNEFAGPLSDEQKKQLGMVKASGRHLLHLINDILDLSKIEAGELVFSNKSFDFCNSIEKVVSLIKPLAEAKGLILTFQIPSSKVLLLSDERRVEQILINLLNNAVKFTDKGSVKIDCQMRGKMLITKVIDTGIGIRKEDIKKLFVPFSQIDSGLARTHDGTGLGLSISQKLVKMLGGIIGVESKIGKGSTFIVSLPLNITPNN